MLRPVRTNGFVRTFNPFLEMERLLGAAARPAATPQPETYLPAVEVVEGQEGLTVTCDLPGVKQENIEVSWDNGVLTIKAERPEAKNDGLLYHVAERRYGRFERSFRLPAHVDGDKISARYTDGVLTLSLPKREEARPRKIQVTA